VRISLGHKHPSVPSGPSRLFGLDVFPASTATYMLPSCARAANAQPGCWTVPFGFTVGTTALSPGMYSVATDGTFRHVVLRSLVRATVQPARRRVSEGRHQPAFREHCGASNKSAKHAIVNVRRSDHATGA
jgi:hypothetical protein